MTQNCKLSYFWVTVLPVGTVAATTTTLTEPTCDFPKYPMVLG